MSLKQIYTALCLCTVLFITNELCAGPAPGTNAPNAVGAVVLPICPSGTPTKTEGACCAWDDRDATKQFCFNVTPALSCKKRPDCAWCTLDKKGKRVCDPTKDTRPPSQQPPAKVIPKAVE